MGTTVTGKLNKAASEFQAGESIGFGVRIGVKYYDRQTKSNEWTNYKAVVFAKQGAQADFYRGALVEGSIVELTCETLKIDQYEGQNGLQLSLDMQGARIGFIHTAQNSGAPNASHAPQRQQGGGQAPQQGYDDFDDDIAF